jgi:hypothetical protein
MRNPNEPRLEDGKTEGIATAAARGEDAHSLKGMISSAMAKSRGQGVVQGSTLFFKNLAESVAHSNRNLKIGLTFLMASFFVVSILLGYLIYQSFRTNVATKQSLEDQYRSLDAKTQKILEPFLKETQSVTMRLAKVEGELEITRMSSKKDVEDAQRELARLSKDLQDTEKKLQDAETWIRNATPEIQKRFAEFGDRLAVLENKK